MSYITMKDFEAEPSRYIVLDKGALTYCSMFKKQFNGNFKRLMACIEDNMTDTEIIYWKAIKDYWDVDNKNPIEIVEKSHELQD